MKKVLCIVGPTGVGKSDLGVNLAKQFHGEIISGDSIQVYRELNVGSAKVTEEEMQGIPHYLIDILDIDQEYNVNDFQKRARDCIEDISNRGKLPMIVGGTGLYVKATLYDYDFPETERLNEEEYASFSNEELMEELKALDAQSADEIHVNNRKRLLRALHLAKTGNKKSETVALQKHEPIYDAYIIGLTMPRDALYERINLRVDKMYQNGLKEEMDALVKKYPDFFTFRSSQGIGYREWEAYYINKEKDVPEVLDDIRKNSRHFARRQYTWFNHQMQVHWFDITDPDYPENVKKEIETWINAGKD